ncbi:MAG: hypothetical protein AAB359_04460 [Elusimicrobiota bacterium]
MKHKELVYRWLKTAGVGFSIVFISLGLTTIIMGHNKRMAPLKPMISEAKDLALNFEQVTKEPDKFLEKHVIWCVQNRSKEETYYKGDSTRRIIVLNHQQMPLVIGSKHSNCADMLLQIKGVRQTSPGSGIPGVMFVSTL